MPSSIETASSALRSLSESWAPTSASERAAFQGWLIRFCEALGVPAPVPPTDEYTFELSVHLIDRDGRESTGFIDCWKNGHFALEAKATDVSDGNEAPLRKAFGQVRNYVAHTKGTPPPYLMVVDVPRTLIVWDRWSGEYGGFPAGRRINLATLHERPDDIRLLQDIFTNPAARDPRGRAQAVTKDIAGKLAELSAAFEGRGHDAEHVARFLMRCVFCFFAEDVDLLPRGLFKRTLETARAAGGPERVGEVLTTLWRKMDEGGDFGADSVRRFNGHFFKTVDSLPLEAADVTLLIEAANFDWSRVEPSIFGTLLVRALDPAERHRLGAEYTPREYIERLVEPTVVEPIREKWTAVQAHVLQMTDAEGKKPARIKKDRTAAVKELLDFHAWMRGLRFLDPACGSGNFLYVTMAAVKRVELEVIREIERVRGREQAEAILEEVHPRQFHGIEVKPWAREIAELTLWIGYHQFWREAHGGRTPPDPVLEDTGTIECRDAVLAWDEIVHRPEKDRPDPTPRVVHPVTGELVPDPAAKVPYYQLVRARRGEWPDADFIVGNPPYLGQFKQREALGDGYTDALRAAYENVPDTADLVMYWWYRSAQAVISGRALRAGLITTNSITQAQNRVVVSQAVHDGLKIVWAAPDHSWIDSVDGAAVRVAMTVVSLTVGQSTLAIESESGLVPRQVPSLNSDLSSHADVARAASIPLLANEGLATPGLKLHGAGFVLSSGEAEDILAREPDLQSVIRPYVHGKDVTQRPRGVYVIDFGMAEESDARQHATAFDLVRARVKPERDSNPRPTRRTYWWRFGEPNPGLRKMTSSLPRFIVTPETAKHRFFVFLPATVAPDNALVCIGHDDPSVLAIVSSRMHVTWALAAGGRLGVGNDPRYNKNRCFDAYPFPTADSTLTAALGATAEKLDLHRGAALARDERVTLTAMYNTVEKLRVGAKLSNKERAIHEIAACGVLMDIHDELDALVAEAYGWPWPMGREEILERLVTLHDERVAEENAGQIRWLRPEYQIPRFAPKAAPSELALKAAPKATVGFARRAIPWPKSSVDQLTAVKAAAAEVGTDPALVLSVFSEANEAHLKRHLETLTMMGEV